MHLVPGAVLCGKYKLVRALASGGMGCIWSAVHTKLKTRLAVKFIHPIHASCSELRTRFEREAIASAKISSAHVVQVHDYGIEEDTPYLVMELLEGEDLGVRLRRDKRLSLEATCTILLQVAKGLRRANEAGIIHRDLKPANIFLARDMDEEVVKILDFGIAKLTSSDAADTTMTGHVVGSPLYMSPEQMQQSKGIDRRSDLWSLAVILFRAITGKLPFNGDDSPSIMMSVLCGPIPVPSQVDPSLPSELDAFFLRAFERDPSKRFQSARELTEAFVEAALGQTTPASSWSIVGLCLGPKADAAHAAHADPLCTTLPSATSADLERSAKPAVQGSVTVLESPASSSRRRAGRLTPWRLLAASALLGIGIGWQTFPSSDAASERITQGVSTAMTTGSSVLRVLSEAHDRIVADAMGGSEDAEAAPASLTKPLDEPISVLANDSEPAEPAEPAPALRSRTARRPR